MLREVSELAKRIERTIEPLSAIIAGSDAEKKVVSTLVQLLEQLSGIEYRVENIYVRTWTPIKLSLIHI